MPGDSFDWNAALAELLATTASIVTIITSYRLQRVRKDDDVTDDE